MMQPITSILTGAGLMNAEAEDFPKSCTSYGHEDGKEGGEERTVTGGKRYGRSNDGTMAPVNPSAMVNVRTVLQRHCRLALDNGNDKNNDNNSSDGLTESGITYLR